MSKSNVTSKKLHVSFLTSFNIVNGYAPIGLKILKYFYTQITKCRCTLKLCTFSDKQLSFIIHPTSFYYHFFLFLCQICVWCRSRIFIRENFSHSFHFFTLLYFFWKNLFMSISGKYINLFLQKKNNISSNDKRLFMVITGSCVQVNERYIFVL